ncbi:MAG TPA: single-stranded DNA-binding protein [Planctomycetes bacterium]|nr:single-stranded DNA-binding protein [Planctomycetota bacterium]
MGRVASWKTITDRLVADVEALSFQPPVAVVYNPLVYARRPFDAYLRRWGRGTKEILLLGMNPGPFGMGQVGVPFGEVHHVRDFLGVRGPVTKPTLEHPKRPVLGFDCPRSEVSGRRLWSWVRRRFETPERFFERFFVLNYCPLMFMEEGGRNRTPDKLAKAERQRLFAACDHALRQAVERLQPRLVVGIGRFARTRAEEALSDLALDFGSLPHPSPANPAANRGWDDLADAALALWDADSPVS